LRHLVAALALAAGAAVLVPGGAVAAELVAEAPAVTVPQGHVAALEVSLSATGNMDCVARDYRPGSASVATSYSLVGGQATSSAPSAPRPFYSDWTPAVQPPARCLVTWAGDPEPYRVPITLAVAPNTAPGDYLLPISSTVTNAGGTSHDPFVDDEPSVIAVNVTESDQPPPPPPPPPAPAVVAKPKPAPPVVLGPRENISFGLAGIRGPVGVRYPGTGRFVPAAEGQQVPPGSSLDTRGGSVKLLADRDGRGRVQEARFWAGVFSLTYTRQVTPGVRSRRRAPAPITELRLPFDSGSCPRASASRDVTSSRRRRRRRGLWGRGRGRYRTRGRHGAGSVRGTHWYTQDTCAGTLFKVRSGHVAVRDFTIRRTVTIRRGQRYLARPRGRGNANG